MTPLDHDLFFWLQTWSAHANHRAGDRLHRSRFTDARQPGGLPADHGRAQGELWPADPGWARTLAAARSDAGDGREPPPELRVRAEVHTGAQQSPLDEGPAGEGQRGGEAAHGEDPQDAQVKPLADRRGVCWNCDYPYGTHAPHCWRGLPDADA